LRKPTQDWFVSEGENMAGQKPLCKIQAGQVSAALWENKITTKDGNEMDVLKVTLQRRYKDKDGNWKSSNSFGRSEIPLAIFCLGKAFNHIIEERTANSNGIEEELVM
jgi:hypothetical protein